MESGETCMLKNHIWYWIHTENLWFVIIKRLIKNGSKTLTGDLFSNGCRPERVVITSKWKKAETES